MTCLRSSRFSSPNEFVVAEPRSSAAKPPNSFFHPLRGASNGKQLGGTTTRSFTIKLLSGAILCCLHFPPIALSQSYTEEPIPHPLPNVLSADLFKGTANTIHVVGVVDSITNISFDDTYGLHKPFYVRRDEGSFSGPLTLPDTGAYYYAPFQGTYYRFAYDASVSGADSVFIVWSRQQFYGTDVPPPVGYVPRVRCVLVSSMQVENLFDVQAAKNPRVATSSDGFAHWAWESVTPVYPDTNYLIYSGSVQYRYRTTSGELSAPQEIDRGFLPQILTDENNVVHLLWLKARNSASEYFQLRYCSGTSGFLSPPVTLLDSVKTYQDFYDPIPPRVAFSVDSSGNVYVGWAEARTYFDSKYFLLVWDGTSVTVDSSGLYAARIPQFAFSPNGEVHAVWGFDQVSYSSNIHGPLFSEVRIFESTVNAGSVRVQLTRSGVPKGIYTDWNLQSINYISNLRDGPDSVFHGPSPGLFPTNQYSVSKPVMIDDQDHTWVAYAKGQFSDYTMWLARFTDEPNSVDGQQSSPQDFALSQNYPNPFNPKTEIGFRTPPASPDGLQGRGRAESGTVSLRVYDLLGREVATLVNEKLGPGTYTRQWDASGMPSGVYFYRLSTSHFVQTRKLILLR